MIIFWLMISQVYSSYCDKFECFTTSKSGIQNQLQLFDGTLAYTFWFKYYLQSNDPLRITIFREQTLALVRGFSYDIIISDQMASHEISLMNQETFWENQLQIPVEQDQGVWHFVIFSIENRYIHFKIIFNGNIYRALIKLVTITPLLIENNLYYPKTVVIICQQQWIDIQLINIQFIEQILDCHDKNSVVSIKYRIDFLNYQSSHFELNYQKFSGWFRDLYIGGCLTLDFYSSNYDKYHLKTHQAKIYIARLLKVSDKFKFMTYDWNSDLFEEYLLQLINMEDLNRWYRISIDFSAKSIQIQTLSQKLTSHFAFFKHYPNAQIQLQVNGTIFQDLYIQDELKEKCSPNCQVCSFNECQVCRGNRITTKCECPVGMIDYGEQDCEYQFRKLDMQIKNTFDDKCPIGYQQCSDQIICDHNYIQYQNKCYKCPQLGEEICQTCQIIPQLLQNKLTCQYVSTANLMRFKNNNIDEFMKFQNQVELLSMETVFYDRELSSIIIEYKFTDSFIPLESIRETKLFQRLECPYNHKAIQNIEYKLGPFCQKLPKGCLDMAFYEYEVICNLCQPNYSLINNQCMKCPQYCQSCTIEKCISCIKQYFVTLSGQCQLCSIPHCQVCYQYINGLFSLNNDFDYKQHQIIYCGLCDEGFEFNYQSLQCQVKKHLDCSISIYDQNSICLIDNDQNHLSTQCSTEHCKQCYLNKCILCQTGYYLDNESCQICEFTQSRINYAENKNFVLNCQLFDPVYYSQFKYQLQHLYILHQNNILKPIQMPLRIVSCLDNLVLYDQVCCQTQNNLLVIDTIQHLCHISIENQQQKQFCLKTNSQYQGLAIDRITGQVKYCDNFKACELSINYDLISNQKNTINYNNFTMSLNEILQGINYDTLVYNQISFLNIKLLFSALNQREISAKGPIKINLFIQSDIREEVMQNLNYINMSEFNEIYFDRINYNFFNIDCVILRIQNYQPNMDQYMIESHQNYFQRMKASQILLQNLTLSSIRITKRNIFQFESIKQLEIKILLIHNTSCYDAELLYFNNYIQDSIVNISSLHILNSNFTNCTLFNIINSDLVVNLNYIIIQNAQFVQSKIIQSQILKANNILINDSVFSNSTLSQTEKYFLGYQIVIIKSTLYQSIIFSSLRHSQLIIKRLKASELTVSSSMLIHSIGLLCHLHYIYIYKIKANSSLYVTSFFVIQGHTLLIDSFKSLQYSGNLTILTVSSQHITLANISILENLNAYTVGHITDLCVFKLAQQYFIQHLYLHDFQNLTISNSYFSNIQSVYSVLIIESQTREQVTIDNITFINIQMFSTNLLQINVLSLKINKSSFAQIWFQDIIMLQSKQYALISIKCIEFIMEQLDMIYLKNINKGQLSWLEITAQYVLLNKVLISENLYAINHLLSDIQRSDYDLDFQSIHKQLIHIDAQNISLARIQIYNISQTKDYLFYFTSVNVIKSIYLNDIYFAKFSIKKDSQYGLLYIYQECIVANLTNFNFYFVFFEKYVFDIRVQQILQITNVRGDFSHGGLVNSHLQNPYSLLLLKSVIIKHLIKPNNWTYYPFETRVMINVIQGKIEIEDFFIGFICTDLLRAVMIESISIKNMVAHQIQSITNMISIQSKNVSQVSIFNLKITESRIFISEYKSLLQLKATDQQQETCDNIEPQYDKVSKLYTPYVLLYFDLLNHTNLNLYNITFQHNTNISTLIKLEQNTNMDLYYLIAHDNNCTSICFQFKTQFDNEQEERLLQQDLQPSLSFIKSIFLSNKGVLFDDSSLIQLIESHIFHPEEIYQPSNIFDHSLILIDSEILYRSQHILRISKLALDNSFIINEEIDHLESYSNTQLILSFDNGVTFYPTINNTVFFYNRARKLVNYCNFPTGQTIGDYQRLSLKELKYSEFIRSMIISISGRFVLQNNYCNIRYLNKSQEFDFRNQHWSQFMIIQQPSQELINLNIQCDSVTLQFNVQILECQLGEIYLNQRCLRCDQSRNEYSVQKHSVQCLTKTDQMISVQSGLIQLKPGYWRPYFNSDSIIKCSNSQNCLGGWNVGDHSCKIGYLGASCQACDLYSIRGTEQYVSNDQECIQCTDTQISAYLYALFVITLQIGLMYTNEKAWADICQNTRNSVLMNIHYRIMLKYSINQIQLTIYIITHYLQILILINRSTQTILQFISSIFRIYSNPNITLYQKAQCHLSMQISQNELVFGQGIFFIVFNILLFNLFMIIQLVLIHRKIKSYDKKLIFVTLYYLITLSYSNYFEIIMKLGTWQNIAGVKWLSANLGMKLNKITNYLEWTSLMIPQIALLFIVFPSIIIVKLKNNKDKLFNKSIFNNWGYLYQYFQSDKYYQGIVIIWYRVIIIGTVYFYQSDASTTYSLISMVMIVAFYQLYHHSPYALKSFNRLNLRIHTMTIIIVMILNLMTRFEEDSNPVQNIICQVSICIIIVILFWQVFMNLLQSIKWSCMNKLAQLSILGKITFIQKKIDSRIRSQDNIKAIFLRLKLSIIKSTVHKPTLDIKSENNSLVRQEASSNLINNDIAETQQFSFRTQRSSKIASNQ